VIDFAPIARFGLLIVRPGMLVTAAPTFGGAYIPTQVRIGLAILLAFTLAPVVNVPASVTEVALFLIVLRELAIGLALGLAVRALISGAEMAGHISGYQLGFSYGSIVDPQSGVRNNMLASLYGNLALLTFFATNGHHQLIRAMGASYTMMPIGPGHVDGSLAAIVTEMLGAVFIVGIRLALPVIVVMLFVELAMGLVSRAAPAINLMVGGMPLRVLVGLIVIASVIPILPSIVGRLTGTTVELGLRAARAFR
jgi:flagellar biosynthetic protein FliR